MSGGILCSRCMTRFKSYLRLQVHMAAEHKINNGMANMTPAEYSKMWSQVRMHNYDEYQDKVHEKNLF